MVELTDINYNNSVINTLTRDMYIGLSNKKEILLKQKIEEAGFGHLLTDVGKKRFPKMCRVKQGEWEYYFVDNDTDNGCFIIAIKDPEFVQTEDNIDFRVTINAVNEWHTDISKVPMILLTVPFYPFAE